MYTPCCSLIATELTIHEGWSRKNCLVWVSGSLSDYLMRIAHKSWKKSLENCKHQSDCNTFSTGAEDFISSPGNKIMMKKGWEQFKEIILRLQKSVQDVLKNVVGREILTLSPFIPGRPGGPGSPGKPKSPFGPWRDNQCKMACRVWHLL